MKQPKTIETEKLLTISEVSNQLGFGKSFINKAKSNLGLPFYKIGGAVRFKRSDLVKWIEERKVCL